MTIEQERDIAVRALELIAEYPKTRAEESTAVSQRAFARTTLSEIQRKRSLQALMDQAQELDMGYGKPSTLCQQVTKAQAEMATWTPEQRASVRLAGGDQASPVAQDEVDQRTERIRRSHVNADSKGKIQLRHEVECLLAHICLLKAGRASVAVQADHYFGDNTDGNTFYFGFGGNCIKHVVKPSAQPAGPLVGAHDGCGTRVVLGPTVIHNPAAQPVGEAVAEWVNEEQGFQYLVAGRLDDGTKLYTELPVAQDQDANRYRFLEEQCKNGSYRGIISRKDIDAAMQAEVKE